MHNIRALADWYLHAVVQQFSLLPFSQRRLRLWWYWTIQKRGRGFNLLLADPREKHRAVQDWVPARWSDRRQELTQSSTGWGTGWRGSRVGERGVVEATMWATVLNLSPPGSWRKRHASATSSPHVASHIKAGDFCSTPAWMLFLPRLWVDLLARRVSGCTVVIPQVFGWREGPSHLCQNGGGHEECEGVFAGV